MKNNTDRTLFKIGYSLAVVIPSDVARKMELKTGDHLKIEYENNKLIITPAGN